MNQDVRLKRLLYRSCHRGCKETDIVMGHFANSRLGSHETSLLDSYEQLLDEDDANIWDWIIGKTKAPEKYETLLEMLKKSKLPATSNK